MNIDHLSDWQIEELLIAPLETRGGSSAWGGSGNAAQDQTRLHLENCTLCRAKKERLEETLLIYREAAFIKTNDAAASNHTMTGHKTHSSIAHPMLWGWPARAFALLLLLAVLIPAFVSRERERRQSQEVARNHLLLEQAKQEQAKDDLLLEQVDQEITESVPQPMQSLTQPVLDGAHKIE